MPLQELKKCVPVPRTLLRQVSGCSDGGGSEAVLSALKWGHPRVTSYPADPL